MLLSMLVIPAAAADPISDYPDDLDAIVELLSGADGVDGESAFDYLGTVFLGWRTTGGPMRIEKAPDPSAYYNYTLDNIPEDPLYYDATRSDEDGNFVRLPDSHTLWGAGEPGDYD